MKRFFWPVLSVVIGALTSSGLLVMLLLWVAWPTIASLPKGTPLTVVTVPFIEFEGHDLNLAIAFKFVAMFGAIVGLITWAVFRPRKKKK